MGAFFAANLADSSRLRSEMGQTQKSECATRQSALPLRTDVASRACQVRKVPYTDLAPASAT